MAVFAALGPDLVVKLVGGSVDGASVMIGRGGRGENNMRAMMEKRFPYIVIVHCGAHSTALASAAASAASEFATYLCDGVQSVYNVYAFSYVRREEFEVTCPELDETAMTHKKIIVTRWLARGNAFRQLTQTLDTNLVCIQKFAAQDEVRGQAVEDDEHERSAATCRDKICTTTFVLAVPLLASLLTDQVSPLRCALLHPLGCNAFPPATRSVNVSHGTVYCHRSSETY